jgi:hypothetical protein
MKLRWYQPLTRHETIQVGTRWSWSTFRSEPVIKPVTVYPEMRLQYYDEKSKKWTDVPVEFEEDWTATGWTM